MGTSPTPFRPKESTPKVLFDFKKALDHICAGQKVSRMEWNNPKIYFSLQADTLHITDENGSHRLEVRYVDIIGTDYFLLT